MRNEIACILLASLLVAAVSLGEGETRTAQITVRVRADDGAVVTGIVVGASTFWRHIPGDNFGRDEYKTVNGSTDTNGLVTLSIPSLTGDVGYGPHLPLSGFYWRRKWLGTVREYSAEEAKAATDEQLRQKSVFRNNPPGMFSGTITKALQDEILAKGIPALSFSTGNNVLALKDVVNFDMAKNRPNGWPRNHEVYHARWLHNDIREMAYLYTYAAFNEMAAQGGLK